MAAFNRHKTITMATAAVLIAASASGVYHIRHAQASEEAAATQAPPAPSVDVDVLALQPVQVWKDFSGRLRAVDFVEIRPEVNGAVQEIRFQDGQLVNKGDVLIVINPAPYQAAVDQAQAALEVAKNQADLARKDLGRAADLVRTAAVSRAVYDQRQSQYQIAQSQVHAAEAAVQQAKIDLDRAYVKAPITGRVSRAELTIGNLVQSGPNSPVLTTIASNDAIYADFDVDEQTYLNSVYSVARDSAAQRNIPVELVLKDAAQTHIPGVIESFDNHIDSNSGTIRARARFDNKDGALLPGMFVSVRLGSASQDKQLLVGETAIGTDQNRKFVYVVDGDNKVAYREIQLGASINGQRVVTSGLAAGDRVIRDGLIKVRPGMDVTVKMASAEPAATPSR